jgi:hypothetical protein
MTRFVVGDEPQSEHHVSRAGEYASRVVALPDSPPSHTFTIRKSRLLNVST